MPRKVIGGLVGAVLSVVPSIGLADSEDSLYNGPVFDEAAFREVIKYAKDEGQKIQINCQRGGKYFAYVFNGLNEKPSPSWRLDYDGTYFERSTCLHPEIENANSINVIVKTMWVVADAEFVMGTNKFDIIHGEKRGILTKLGSLVRKARVKPKLF
ncbi:hypothetical protein HYT24_01060 [Candidatus Pacearchaeota archaeon]|nr:hypothetical protein [Candidatus Pacearchaeota archaeon]